MTVRGYTVLVFNQATQAIIKPTNREENGKFCVAVGPVTSTVGMANTYQKMELTCLGAIEKQNIRQM